MLTIQPVVSSLNCKKPSFGNDGGRQSVGGTDTWFDDFNIEEEKKEIKKDNDLWADTKKSLDTLAKTTESVPLVKKGTDVLSGLTTVAIGWGGLRWGSVGTLEVLSKAGETSLGKFVKNIPSKVKSSPLSKYFAQKYSTLKTSMLDTALGKKYSSVKSAITSTDAYKSLEKTLTSLNPKRVFVETMGVAGGGSAALNLLGAHTVNGNKDNVEQDEKGNYKVNGRDVQLSNEEDDLDVA